MPACRYAEGVHGQRKVGNPCMYVERQVKHGIRSSSENGRNHLRRRRSLSEIKNRRRASFAGARKQVWTGFDMRNRINLLQQRNTLFRGFAKARRTGKALINRTTCKWIRMYKRERRWIVWPSHSFYSVSSTITPNYTRLSTAFARLTLWHMESFTAVLCQQIILQFNSMLGFVLGFVVGCESRRSRQTSCFRLQMAFAHVSLLQIAKLFAFHLRVIFREMNSVWQLKMRPNTADS